MRALTPSTIALGLALAGCGNAGPGEPVGQAESPVTFPNDQAAYCYFVDKGLTDFQAAGIVGNLDQESGMNPAAVQNPGPGRGIAQWSAGARWDTDANDNAAWYAATQGQSAWSLEAQLGFIWYELTTFSGYGLAPLRNTANVTDATIVFQNDFEACGTCNQSGRIAYAEAVLPSCCAPQCSGKACGAADGCGGACQPGSGCCTSVWKTCPSRGCHDIVDDSCGHTADCGDVGYGCELDEEAYLQGALLDPAAGPARSYRCPRSWRRRSCSCLYLRARSPRKCGSPHTLVGGDRESPS